MRRTNTVNKGNHCQLYGLMSCREICAYECRDHMAALMTSPHISVEEADDDDDDDFDDDDDEYSS